MVFCFVQNYFFRTTQELEYFLFQNLTLGYMTKTLNQIFFFLHQNQNICFQQHWESEYFFRKKLQVKWSFPKHLYFFHREPVFVLFYI
jgi:hypothetical protein